MHLWYKKAQIKCNIFFFHVWDRKLYILLLYLYGGLKITVHVLYTFKLQQVVYHVHAHYTWGSTPLYLDLLIFSHCTSTSSPVPFSTGFSPVKIIIVNENFVTNCISLIFLTNFLECCLLEYPMFFVILKLHVLVCHTHKKNLYIQTVTWKVHLIFPKVFSTWLNTVWFTHDHALGQEVDKWFPVLQQTRVT